MLVKIKESGDIGRVSGVAHYLDNQKLYCIRDTSGIVPISYWYAEDQIEILSPIHTKPKEGVNQHT